METTQIPHSVRLNATDASYSPNSSGIINGQNKSRPRLIMAINSTMKLEDDGEREKRPVLWSINRPRGSSHSAHVQRKNVRTPTTKGNEYISWEFIKKYGRGVSEKWTGIGQGEHFQRDEKLGDLAGFL